MSAMTASRSPSSSSAMTPRFGLTVVNGYAPTSGRASVTAASSVDLPAFGAPTRPMSAMSFSSSSIQRSSPGVPFSAWRGARLVAVAKRRCRARPARRARRPGAHRFEELADPLAVGVGAHDGAGRDAEEDVGALRP